ncbi:class I SAM-dependent methyltransferase [Haloferula sargassicola]|uniref:class I SAM-dependent methyltransferase n=1 Tax=Haloferula sargassicola TaxID=490096 RepID=UPI003365A02D
MKAYRSTSDLPLSRLFRGFAGKVLMNVRPDLARRVRHQPFSLDWGTLGRLVRNGYFLRAVAERDHGLLHDFLRDYWSSPRSREFFDHFGHRFETVFLEHHRAIVDEIGQAVASFEGGPARLIEVGVGDARVINYLMKHLEGIQTFHGIDLNATQIEENRHRFRNRAELHFHCGEAHHWLIRHPAPGTVIFTNGGVLEYFRRRDLFGLFRELAATSSPCVVALTETIAVDHDLDGDPDSHAYGHEFSFSHNYPDVLRNAGFKITFLRDRFTLEGEEHHPARWLQVVAKAPSCS